LNEYKGLRRLRIADNPITSTNTKEEKKNEARQQIFSRIQFLQYYNGSKIGDKEKED